MIIKIFFSILKSNFDSSKTDYTEEIEGLSHFYGDFQSCLDDTKRYEDPGIYMILEIDADFPEKLVKDVFCSFVTGHFYSLSLKRENVTTTLISATEQIIN